MSSRWPARLVRLTFALAATTAALLIAGCSDGYKALGTHTARVMIDGGEVRDRPRVRCEQVGWVWHIETLQQTSGFRAQVQTGSTTVGRLVRIDNLGGFTGSAWNAAAAPPSVHAEATLEDGKFTITGTAVGYFRHDPGKTRTADFEIQTDC